MSVVSSNAPAAGIETASLWARTLAIVVDLFFVSVIQGVINGVFGSEHITNAILEPSTSGGYSSYTSSTTVDGVWLWVAAIMYFALLEGLFGDTVGKAVLGIGVTDLNGRPASWRAVVIRLTRCPLTLGNRKLPIEGRAVLSRTSPISQRSSSISIAGAASARRHP